MTLYTWRSISRGIPSPKSNEDPNRHQIHVTTVDILLPEVDKLYSLIRFQKVAIERFCSEVKLLCHPEKRKEFVSSAYLLTLGKFINMFAILDELKNVKSSVKTDYSTFRRAAMYLKLLGDSQALQESQNLSVFLATPNKIRDNLRENLEKMQNYEEVLADVINICVEMFEQRLYVTLEEKHMLVKVIGFSLGLMDNRRCSVYKLDQRKKVKIDKIDHIFKLVPVVPLYGDMQISPFDYIKSGAHFDASKWPNCSAAAAAIAHHDYSRGGQLDLVKLLPRISMDHQSYLCQLQEHCSGVSEAGGVDGDDTACNLALKGLQLLSEWSSAILELHSWKLLHPTDHHQTNQCPTDAEAYERATRFNYSSSEKSALIQLLGMIKGLQNTLAKIDSLLAPAIRQSIYLKLQQFAQLTLREPLRKSTKHKKDVLRSVLMSIRETCAECLSSQSNTSSSQGPTPKGEKSLVEVRLLKRCVGPSSTQLYLIQTMLESILSDKTCAKHHLRRDLDPASLPALQTFHRQTFFWTYLLNLPETLEKCCNLGQLWYREFYLELSMGRRVQFPIEMSLPWILLEHVLLTPNLLEYALYPLDLYNDSAHCALNIFKKQWLFDELLAEVNLCFDQFVYKLSEQLYAHFKRQAATNFLEWRLKKDVTPVAPVKYQGLISQRRVYLLGHYIDLNMLIRQRVQQEVLKSLQAAVRKFEEGDISGVVQLDKLLQVNRETHKMLLRWIPGLDNFEMIWMEANESVVGGGGRVEHHILKEVTQDLVTDWCYNGTTKRFVRTEGVRYSKVEKREVAQPVPAQYLWGSKQLNGVWGKVGKMCEGFVGEPHFRAIVALLGYQGITKLVKLLLEGCRELVGGELGKWVEVLKESVLPKYVRAPVKPLAGEGTPGLLTYYLEVLGGVVQNPGVKMRLFQCFREVGNAVVVCWEVEQTMAREESLQIRHVLPFQGKRKGEVVAEEENTAKEVNQKEKLEAMMMALHVAGNVGSFGTEGQRGLVKQVELLSNELMTFGLRIFPGVLEKFREMLVGVEGDGKEDGRGDDGGNRKRSIWMGPPPVNHVMNMHRCSEFHRVWSALQFVCCIPVKGKHEFSVE